MVVLDRRASVDEIDTDFAECTWELNLKLILCPLRANVVSELSCCVWTILVSLWQL